jgi:hypothetical protein
VDSRLEERRGVLVCCWVGSGIKLGFWAWLNEAASKTGNRT